MDQTTGRVNQVLGSVVDVEFRGEMPEVYEALIVKAEGGKDLVLEVQKQLPDNWVRCIGMDSTDGLVRGMPVARTHAPIKVPVGKNTLGRIFNVLGKPVDNQGPVESDLYYPIHRPAPDGSGPAAS